MNKKTAFLIGTILQLLFCLPVLAEEVNITILHLNDIYEITPVEGGKKGGLSRVATLRKQLLQKNPHTYTILAGDALSPSALGTAKINGVPLAGQQMIDVMNTVGFDYVTFGNHEFDLPENLFYQRLKASKFTWFSSNVSNSKGLSFPNVPRSVIINIKTSEGKTVKIGLIGLTLNSNHANYVTYENPITIAKKEVNKLKNKVDIIIAVTHLSINEDQKLAQEVPEINMILGGHEHENIQQWRGKNFTPIFKADANARTVYIHNLIYDTDTKKLKIISELQPITEQISDDIPTNQVIDKWLKLGFQAFQKNGFNPSEIITTINTPLDGLESSVRNQSTNLTQLIAEGMLNEVKGADLAIFNSGAIRIDDMISEGNITQYDVIRILPFGGKILEVEMTGEILKRVLDQGRMNKGNGGYLQTMNVSLSGDDNDWLINNQHLDLQKKYRVAINDFLLTGKEQGLDFLKLNQPGIKLISEKRDIRFVLIDQLKSIKN